MHLLVLSAFRHYGVDAAVGQLPVSMHLLVLSAFRPVEPGSHRRIVRRVSMHLLVLSAFRHWDNLEDGQPVVASQCTFWCSVLSDKEWDPAGVDIAESQCTFWCSVLSDLRLFIVHCDSYGLNAPFGAQCFPTFHHLVCSRYHYPGLNAPFGAQCFPTSRRKRR